MTLLSGTQWVAVRLELIAVRSGMRSTQEQDWLRVLFALHNHPKGASSPKVGGNRPRSQLGQRRDCQLNLLGSSFKFCNL